MTGLSRNNCRNNDPGSICWLVGFPERGQGAIVMLNGNNGELLALEILSALGRVYGWVASPYESVITIRAVPEKSPATDIRFSAEVCFPDRHVESRIRMEP